MRTIICNFQLTKKTKYILVHCFISKGFSTLDDNYIRITIHIYKQMMKNTIIGDQFSRVGIKRNISDLQYHISTVQPIIIYRKRIGIEIFLIKQSRYLIPSIYNITLLICIIIHKTPPFDTDLIIDSNWYIKTCLIIIQYIYCCEASTNRSYRLLVIWNV